jgi:hypothetical protein
LPFGANRLFSALFGDEFGCDRYHVVPSQISVGFWWICPKVYLL